MYNRILGTAAVLTALSVSGAAAQSPQPTVFSKDVVAARADSIVRAFMAEKGPASMSVAISVGNEMLFQRAYGSADIAANRAATPATVYKIGSVSKQFTAVLILKQVERGKLSLADSIGSYLTTGLRPEWRSLNIEQLLNHTAGLQNDLTRDGNPEEEVSTEKMIAWAARDTMAFAPGTRYAYSNVGYLLLGALVEKLYGKPYGVVLQEEIARPLGLRTLRWCTDPKKDTTVAVGYSYGGPSKLDPAPYAHPSKSLGAGGLCASAGDLSAWNRALHGGRVLKPASYTAMITPRAPSKGYGFGLQLSQRPAPWNRLIIGHFGGILGFSAQNVWVPADSLSITVLFNSLGNGFPPNFALDLGSAMYGPPVTAASPSAVESAPAVAIVGEEARGQFVGEYELRRGQNAKVDFVEGAYVLTTPGGTKSRLVHESGLTYKVPDIGARTTLTFLADKDGRIVGFSVLDGSESMRLRKVR